MGRLLNLAYLVATVVALPWLVYRLIVRGDRHGLLTRFGWGLGPGLKNSIWLHGASAGEISLLRPLVDLLEKDVPATPLVISAYSSTGLAAARRAFPKHRVIFFPFDLTFIVSRFLKLFDPRLIVIVESDFWPNFLSAAQRLEIPVGVVNGKMSLTSYQRNVRMRLLPMMLRHIALLAVQTDEHAERLRRLGVPESRLRVTGNMKYDLAQPVMPSDHTREIRSALGYGSEDVVIIGGSVHEREDGILLDAFLNLRHQGHRGALIIVPRYPTDAARVEQAVQARGQLAVLKTAVDRGERTAPGPDGVLIVDTVGELRTLYAAADIAFVGGSLFYRGSNKGGHNLMEPAILGLPTLFGPYNFSFRETVHELLRADAGFEVHDRTELEAALTSLIGNRQRRREVGGRARDVVLRGQGATRRNYELLVPLLGSGGERLPASAFERTMPSAASETDPR